MVKVLHELSALDGGGIAKLVYDYYLHMDHDKIHFDFLIYDYYDEGIYEQPLKNLGCNIYKIPRIKKDKKGYLRGMEKVIKEGNYDVVHSHMGSRGLFAMYFGKKYGVKMRIVHSHIAFEPVSSLKRKFNCVLAKIAKHYATDLFACGQDAGVYMWGRKAAENGKVHIMTNAVDTEKFKFSKEIRDKKREEIGVVGKLVIGIVGRLSEQKNYPFLFASYKKLLEKRNDTVLVIVGRGLDEEKIKAQAKNMGLQDSIKFLGIRSDVAELLNAFDVFVLPSLYEGLPVVLIEAQANGVQEIVSDRVTSEMDITDLIRFLPIEGTENDWAEAMALCKDNSSVREKYSQQVSEAGYDIRVESKKMQDYYLGI
ncbi:MAG: glycosyltransferase family 1 protein [Oscillospiraceae bacterium]